MVEDPESPILLNTISDLSLELAAKVATKDDSDDESKAKQKSKAEMRALFENLLTANSQVLFHEQERTTMKRRVASASDFSRMPPGPATSMPNIAGMAAGMPAKSASSSNDLASLLGPVPVHKSLADSPNSLIPECRPLTLQVCRRPYPRRAAQLPRCLQRRATQLHSRRPADSSRPAQDIPDVPLTESAMEALEEAALMCEEVPPPLMSRRRDHRQDLRAPARRAIRLR